MEVIGEKYDFSERLRALMKMKPNLGAKSPGGSGLKRRQAPAVAQTTTSPGRRVTSAESALERGEKASNTESNTQSDEPPPPIPRAPNMLGEDIALYLLLKDTVNYFSIDHTERGNGSCPPEAQVLVLMMESSLYRSSLALPKTHACGGQSQGWDETYASQTLDVAHYLQ